MTRVLVSTATFGPESIALFREAAPGLEVLQFPRAAIEDVPADVLAQAEILYTFTNLPTRAAAPKLRWVQTNWAGVDKIVGAPLFSQGDVLLTTGAGIHAINMSEHTLMMMLALAHKLPTAFALMRERKWKESESNFMPMELRGATLGLIGYGSIGREIARLAQAFGMRVMALRRSTAADDSGVEFIRREGLAGLLRVADFVVLVVPSTAETRNILGSGEIAQMKPGACLINIGRGDAVDEDALATALREGHLGGAALDVFRQEPLPAESPLWALASEGRVILTPHVAGQTPNYEKRAAELLANNLRRYVAGEPLINRVDFDRGY